MIRPNRKIVLVKWVDEGFLSVNLLDRSSQPHTMLQLSDSGVFFKAGVEASAGHWCFAGEIKEVEMMLRLRLIVKDANGPGDIVVAYYLDDDKQDEVAKLFKQCKEGYTIFILDAMHHYFLDGTFGFRLEDTTTTKVHWFSIMNLPVLP